MFSLVYEGTFFTFLKILQIVIFSMFPILIFWALIQIAFGDPGVVTDKMVSEIYEDNGIKIELLTDSYDKRVLNS